MTPPWLHSLRLGLADDRATLHYAALGIIAGALTALLMAAFRLLLLAPGHWLMPAGDPEAFEQLTHWERLALPLAGALSLGLVLMLLRDEHRRVGVAHVIKRLHGHSGELPLVNLLVQFFGGAWVLICGLSGGREGPAIHIGAASNSLLGRYLGLPNNSVRTLIGCGTAAAIAASFDTPIAGVIFAMEVVMMEYTIAGFMPVMLATVTATTISRALFGPATVFAGLEDLTLQSLWELPFIVLLGIAAGFCSASFVVVMRRAMAWQHLHILPRLLVAGAVTGVLGLAVPQIMGIGYDTLALTLQSQPPLLLLAMILVAKLVATAIGCGLGVPTGVIGANLLIGACLGAALGQVGSQLVPELAATPSFYAMLGMGATMGAVLNAPLAALTALLEFTGNIDIVFPGMLVIVVANLTHSSVCRQQSAHQILLNATAHTLRTDPVSLALSRGSVAGVMDRNVRLLQDPVSREDIDAILARPPNWLVIQKDDDSHWLLHRDHALPLLEAHTDTTPLALLAISDRSIRATEVPMMATLREALDLMDAQDLNAVFIATYLFDSPYPDAGVLTRTDIERYYRSPRQG